MSYVQNELNEVFNRDQIILSYLGMKHQGKIKQIPKSLTSDVQIQCSLSFNMNQPPLTQQLVGILITVDAYNMLRVYL